MLKPKGLQQFLFCGDDRNRSKVMTSTFDVKLCKYQLPLNDKASWVFSDATHRSAPEDMWSPPHLIKCGRSLVVQFPTEKWRNVFLKLKIVSLHGSGVKPCLLHFIKCDHVTLKSWSTLLSKGKNWKVPETEIVYFPAAFPPVFLCFPFLGNYNPSLSVVST